MFEPSVRDLNIIVRTNNILDPLENFSKMTNLFVTNAGFQHYQLIIHVILFVLHWISKGLKASLKR